MQLLCWSKLKMDYDFVIFSSTETQLKLCCVNILWVCWLMCLLSTGFSSRCRCGQTDRQTKASCCWREPLPAGFPWNTYEHDVISIVILVYNINIKGKCCYYYYFFKINPLGTMKVLINLNLYHIMITITASWGDNVWGRHMAKTRN